MDVIRKEFNESVCRIIFNRPDRKNAMNAEFLSSFREALEEAGNRKSTVVVIRGTAKTFSAGGDIGEFRELVREGKSLDTGVMILNECILMLRGISAITVAVLEGIVMGAGIGISLACDLSVAFNSTIMNMAYRKIGLTPDAGASVMLPGIIGAKRSNELYFLARNLGMEEAKDIGLVNYVWKEEEFETRLEKLIVDLKTLPAETIGPFKKLTNRALFNDLEKHLNNECRFLSELGKEPGFKKRLERFLGKK